MLNGIRKHALGEEAPPKEKKPRKYSESDDQKRVVKWMRERPNWLVMRMENAARRTMAQAARDKALGMEPGAPDLVVAYRDFVFFLEMKRAKGGVISDEQAKIHRQLHARGCTVMIGRGYDQTIKTLERIEESKGIYGTRAIIEQSNVQR